MRFPQNVRMVEVAPRDGLQNEPSPVRTDVKIALVDRLSEAGLQVVEAGSFVSPARVPPMAGTDKVLAGIKRMPGVRYPVLVPNMRGLRDAVAAGAEDIAVLSAATESFCRENLGCTLEESLQRARAICAEAANAGLRIRGYVSCALGCPYEGEVSPAAAATVAADLREAGCREICLADTIGVGTPGKARSLVDAVIGKVPVQDLAAHFHDTYGQALANVLAVMDLGVAVFDSSVAGLGGCPFAPGAAGNVASEDLLYMLNGLGIETGVDLDALIDAGNYICGELGRPSGSRVARALAGK